MSQLHTCMGCGRVSTSILDGGSAETGQVTIGPKERLRWICARCVHDATCMIARLLRKCGRTPFAALQPAPQEPEPA